MHAVALGLVALWLSVSFYHRGKDTEKHVKQLGDQTATDYRLLTNLIHSNFDEATIQGNRLHHLYVRARGWESVIRDTTTVYDCSRRCVPVTMKDRVPGKEG